MPEQDSYAAWPVTRYGVLPDKSSYFECQDELHVESHNSYLIINGDDINSTDAANLLL